MSVPLICCLFVARWWQMLLKCTPCSKNHKMKLSKKVQTSCVLYLVCLITPVLLRRIRSENQGRRGGTPPLESPGRNACCSKLHTANRAAAEHGRASTCTLPAANSVTSQKNLAPDSHWSFLENTNPLEKKRKVCPDSFLCLILSSVIGSISGLR